MTMTQARRRPEWLRRANLGTGDYNNDLTTSDSPGPPGAAPSPAAASRPRCIGPAPARRGSASPPPGWNSKGEWAAYRLLSDDGTVEGTRWGPDEYYNFWDSAAAASGPTLLLAYYYEGADDLSIHGLAVKGMPYDTSLSAELPAPLDLHVASPAAWSASRCGTNCLAVPYVPASGASHHLSVRFFDEGVDDLGLFDAKCNAGGNSLLASGTYANGHFGVAWGSSEAVELYECKAPVP